MKISASFLASWDNYMFMGGYALVGIAVLILLYHEFRLFQIKDYKEKYDYVNLHEINYFWYGVIAIILAAALFSNTIATHTIEFRGILWFYVRLFITVCFAIIAYIVLSSMVRIYYPRTVEKRLNKIRNKPRTSPEGNTMRKLSEEEEDAHLDAGQIAEEASGVHSVDYDVWLDEKTGHKIVEKYYSYQHTEECPNCGYFTMKIATEELEIAPTQDEPGKLVKHYQCSYCSHREQKEVTLAKLSTNA
jgi:hypothetical protein